MHAPRQIEARKLLFEAAPLFYLHHETPNCLTETNVGGAARQAFGHAIRPKPSAGVKTSRSVNSWLRIRHYPSPSSTATGTTMSPFAVRDPAGGRPPERPQSPEEFARRRP